MYKDKYTEEDKDEHFTVIDMSVALNRKDPSIKIYHDFIDSNKLDRIEKAIFIALKYCASGKDEEEHLLDLNKVEKYTHLDSEEIQKRLAIMESKGVLKLETRKSEDNSSNETWFRLYDYAETWQSNKTDKIQAKKKKKKKKKKNIRKGRH